MKMFLMHLDKKKLNYNSLTLKELTKELENKV